MVERIEEVEGVYPPGVDGKKVDVTTTDLRYRVVFFTGPF